MATTKQLSIAIVALAVVTMGIPAFGLTPFGADQTNNIASSQSNAQDNSNQQAGSTTGQKDTQATEQSTQASQQTTQSTGQTDDSSGDRSLMDVFQEAKTSYRQIDDLKATVKGTATISNADGSKSYEATADVAYKSPNKFRVEVVKPKAQAGTVVASDGTTATHYNPSSNTARTLPMSEITSLSPAKVMGVARSSGLSQADAAVAAMGAGQLRAASMEKPSKLLRMYNVTYEGTKTVNGYETDVISLSRENESMGYSTSATLYLDQETNLPVKAVSNTTLTRDGQETTINSTLVVTNLKVNSGVSDSVFDVDVPDDAEQVDGSPTAPGKNTFYQVDFVVGEPIENLRGPEGTYQSDELIRFAHGSTEDPITRRSNGEFITNGEMAERIESKDITVENGTATITFTVTEGKPVTLTLASYEKVGPGWSPATEAKQEFIDADTQTFESGTHTLTVELPDSESDE